MRARDARTVVASCLAVAIGGVGCNMLVSAGDYHVEAEGADATTDTSVPSTDAGIDRGASPSDGGSDREAAPSDAGAADDHAADASRDAARDAGEVDTGADATPTCGSTIPLGSADFQQLVRACVLDVGCDPYNYYNNSIDDCIAMSSLTAFGATACESTALNCADISACRGSGWALDCDGGHAAYCDGTNRAINCRAPSENESPGYFTDCNKNGGACRVYATDAGPLADCLVGGCGDPTDGIYRCRGNDLYTCVGDAGFGENCNQYQATCKDPNDAGASCFYNLPDCPEAGAPACDPNGVGQVCFSDTQQLGRFHCATAGLRCEPVADAGDGYPFRCVAPGCTAADVASCIEGCNIEIASFCVGGAKINFDCTSVGLHCHQLTTTATPPVQLAECAPF